MFLIMLFVFIVGYVAIAIEHNIRIDKSASALFIGTLTWTILMLGAGGILHVDTSLSIQQLLESGTDFLKPLKEYFILHFDAPAGETQHLLSDYILEELKHHVMEISEILFFLLGAMTIVELIDAHNGFDIITSRIRTTNRLKLLIILTFITFFLSSVLDNLTTVIVMSALLKKLLHEKADLWLFAGMIIIAANAGGAWSPIGDVTTIMLWIGGQISTINIMSSLIIPSLLCIIVPLIFLGFKLKGHIAKPESEEMISGSERSVSNKDKNLIFITGISSLLFVPVFKTITHLPPFLGILMALGIMWILTEIIHRGKNQHEKYSLSITGVLKKVDVPSVLFFLGILLAVASLNTAGHLVLLAEFLENSVGDIYLVNVIIGLLSSVIDNVPLVAGAMGMYEVGPEIAGISYPMDHKFWHLLAYCAGTGGSCLIIGSAAGVAVMGILKIDFIWYLKRISGLALLGYLAGVLAFYLIQG